MGQCVTYRQFCSGIIFIEDALKLLSFWETSSRLLLSELESISAGLILELGLGKDSDLDSDLLSMDLDLGLKVCKQVLLQVHFAWVNNKQAY